jgi:hypothetical protein
MTYRIGNPLTGAKEPEEYEELEDAEIAAIQASIDDGLWGVWDEDDGELVSLAFGQRVFD